MIARVIFFILSIWLENEVMSHHSDWSNIISSCKPIHELFEVSELMSNITHHAMSVNTLLQNHYEEIWIFLFILNYSFSSTLLGIRSVNMNLSGCFQPNSMAQNNAAAAEIAPQLVHHAQNHDPIGNNPLLMNQVPAMALAHAAQQQQQEREIWQGESKIWSLMALRHYLIQSWPIINKVLWLSLDETIFVVSAQVTILCIESGSYSRVGGVWVSLVTPVNAVWGNAT